MLWLALPQRDEHVSWRWPILSPSTSDIQRTSRVPLPDRARLGLDTEKTAELGTSRRVVPMPSTANTSHIRWPHDRLGASPGAPFSTREHKPTARSGFVVPAVEVRYDHS